MQGNNFPRNASVTITASVIATVFLSWYSFWCRAGGLDHWNLRNPEWAPYPLYSACYGSNQFVAAGSGGSLYTSSDDGLQWSNTVPYFSNSVVYTVVYAQGQYVAQGNYFVDTSPDGINWTYHTNTDGDPCVSIVYGAGLYVGISEPLGRIYTSTNGIDWVQQYESPYEQFSVTYGAGRFVAVGIDGSILTSTNGTNWDFQIVDPNDFRGVSYGNSQFVAVGDFGTVYISSDGLNWTGHPLGSINFSALTFGNGNFVAPARSGFTPEILTSTDGIHWGGGIVGDYPNNVAAGNGVYVGVCNDSTILRSTDGAFWNPVGTDSRATVAGIACGNNRFVAVASEANLVSPDGIHWTMEAEAYQPNGIGFGSNLFITFGESSTILSSSDGVNWNPNSSGDGSALYSVAYGNGRYVAVGGGTLTSSDGINWTNQSTTGFSAIAFGNGIFVATGGRVRTSSDGVNWGAAISTPPSSVIPQIAFGNGTFVIVGSGGLILSSADGTNWVQRSAGTGADLSGIGFGQGTFLVAAYNGAVFSSGDGISWQPRNTGVALGPLTVAYGNNSFVLAGPGGLLLQSDPVTSLGIQQQGSAVQLAISCDAGSGCRLQSSTDLVSWSDVFGTNAYGSFTWTDEGVNDSTRRFYRIVTP